MQDKLLTANMYVGPKQELQIVPVQAVQPTPYFDGHVMQTDPIRYNPTLQLVQLIAESEQVLQFVLHNAAISVPGS